MNLTKYLNSELGIPFSNLRDHVNRFFDQSFPTRASAESFGDWVPALDAFEDKDKYVVSLEIPGMKKEDINVTVQDGVLTVSGERKVEKSSNEGAVHRSERFYGKFSRSVSLPAAVSADKVGAAYRDGVLTVEIPKAEEAKPRQVEIKVS
jgi:HSP20 family protein